MKRRSRARRRALEAVALAGVGRPQLVAQVAAATRLAATAATAGTDRLYSPPPVPHGDDLHDQCAVAGHRPSVSEWMRGSRAIVPDRMSCLCGQVEWTPEVTG